MNHTEEEWAAICSIFTEDVRRFQFCNHRDLVFKETMGTMIFLDQDLWERLIALCPLDEPQHCVAFKILDESLPGAHRGPYLYVGGPHHRKLYDLEEI